MDNAIKLGALQLESQCRDMADMTDNPIIANDLRSKASKFAAIKHGYNPNMENTYRTVKSHTVKTQGILPVNNQVRNYSYRMIDETRLYGIGDWLKRATGAVGRGLDKVNGAIETGINAAKTAAGGVKQAYGKVKGAVGTGIDAAKLGASGVKQAYGNVKNFYNGIGRGRELKQIQKQIDANPNYDPREYYRQKNIDVYTNPGKYQQVIDEANRYAASKGSTTAQPKYADQNALAAAYGQGLTAQSQAALWNHYNQNQGMTAEELKRQQQVLMAGQVNQYNNYQKQREDLSLQYDKHKYDYDQARQNSSYTLTKKNGQTVTRQRPGQMEAARQAQQRMDETKARMGQLDEAHEGFKQQGVVNQISDFQKQTGMTGNFITDSDATYRAQADLHNYETAQRAKHGNRFDRRRMQNSPEYRQLEYNRDHVGEGPQMIQINNNGTFDYGPQTSVQTGAVNRRRRNFDHAQDINVRSEQKPRNNATKKDDDSSWWGVNKG